MKTQNTQILAHLKTGQSINPLQALNKFGCFRLSARIFNLKDEGYDIEMTTKPNKDKVGYHAVYKLIEDNIGV